MKSHADTTYRLSSDDRLLVVTHEDATVSLVCRDDFGQNRVELNLMRAHAPQLRALADALEQPCATAKTNAEGQAFSAHLVGKKGS